MGLSCLAVGRWVWGQVVTGVTYRVCLVPAPLLHFLSAMVGAAFPLSCRPVLESQSMRGLRLLKHELGRHVCVSVTGRC